MESLKDEFVTETKLALNISVRFSLGLVQYACDFGLKKGDNRIASGIAQYSLVKELFERNRSRKRSALFY